MPYIGKKPENIIATAVDSTTGTFSGDVTSAGTVNVTGDTAAGDDAAIGFTSAEGLILTGQGSTSDITVKNDADATVFTVPTGTDDILFPDNAKILMGAGSDLQIYHDGSHSYVQDSGTGNIRIKGANIEIVDNDDGGSLLQAVQGGAVQLFHNNSERIATTSSGIDVTGSISADVEIDCASSSALSTISATATGSCNLVMGTNFSGSASQGMANQSGFLNMRQDFPIIFGTSETERMRIFGNGNITFSTTDQSPAEGTATGGRIGTSGKLQLSATGDQTVVLNRLQDGSVLGFRSAGTAEGGISISGNTVSFNAFSGSHWSRLTDNSKPTILKGTIIETIDEMCDWYQAEFEADGTTKKVGYALKDGEKVGDTITYTYKQDDVEDADYQATIIKEKDNKHTKCKISDTADSKRVYGVFADWDNDDDTVNDMYVTAVGTHVVRINKDVTVSSGDLLSSNGDGTAKVQDDDIIRSKTIGKVLTNIKQETYDDGSYTVPCALYCG